LPARGFRYPTSLASKTSADPSKLPDLDAALCGIKVNSGNPHLPIEFEFDVLNPNLLAPMENDSGALSSARFEQLDGFCRA
jgi:hypothetical protein